MSTVTSPPAEAEGALGKTRPLRFMTRALPATCANSQRLPAGCSKSNFFPGSQPLFRMGPRGAASQSRGGLKGLLPPSPVPSPVCQRALLRLHGVPDGCLDLAGIPEPVLTAVIREGLLAAGLARALSD